MTIAEGNVELFILREVGGEVFAGDALLALDDLLGSALTYDETALISTFRS